MKYQEKIEHIQELENICQVMRQYCNSVESEHELYNTITDLQTAAYKFRAIIWTQWKENGIIEEMRPPASK